MLEITLTDARIIELVPHRPADMIHTRGDGYGNGSIDWMPDGAFVSELLEKLEEKETRKPVAVMRDGEMLMPDSFITENCTAEIIYADDDLGQSMARECADFFVCLAMHQLFPLYEELPGKIALRYGYMSPSAEQLSKEDLGKLNQQLAEYLKSPPVIKRYLKNYQKTVKQLAQQGQNMIAKCMLLYDDTEPVAIYEADGFIRETGKYPMLSPKDVAEIKIVSQEILTILPEPILILTAQVKV